MCLRTILRSEAFSCQGSVCAVKTFWYITECASEANLGKAIMVLGCSFGLTGESMQCGACKDCVPEGYGWGCLRVWQKFFVGGISVPNRPEAPQGRRG